MAEIMTESGTTHRETRIYVFRGVQVHRRKDAQGQFTLLDAIDEDEKKIRQIADRLQRHGYGVMREAQPRRARLLHLQGNLGRSRDPPG